jgi:TrmH family RNA methyltransferase
MPRIKAITSRENPLLVRLRKIAADPGGYRRFGDVWLEGEHLCSAFLAHGGAPALAVVTESAWGDTHWRDLAARAPDVAVVPRALMDALSTLESSAPLGFVVPWQGMGELLPGVSSVVLDRLQDAGNVGTILRTASAFGVTQVVALTGTAALWSQKVLRAGMGAHFRLRLVENALPQDLEALALPLVATSSHGSLALPDVSLPFPCAWLLGHEGQGIDAALLQKCSHAVTIPQPGGEESLNVASAAAVCLYEALRQRRGR